MEVGNTEFAAHQLEAEVQRCVPACVDADDSSAHRPTGVGRGGCVVVAAVCSPGCNCLEQLRFALLLTPPTNPIPTGEDNPVLGLLCTLRV